MTAALTKQAVREYWDANVDGWKIATHPPGSPEFFLETEQYRFEKLDYLPRRVDYSGFPGRRVLEIGCGLGNDLSRFVRGGAVVTGIDLSVRAIELARLNFAQRKLHGTFEVMDGEAMSFPDGSFDLVYCHTVLHFTPDPARMVREAHRVLSNGGLAIIMVVNRASWMNWMRRIAHVEIDNLDSPVFRHMTIDEFREILRPFPQVEVVPERFPVPTRVHGGAKAWLYNHAFVGGFRALPESWTRHTGHHLLAFCRKAAEE